MNILIVSRHEPIPAICGVETVSQMLYRKFKKDGHNVFSLALVKSGLQLAEDIHTDYFPSEDLGAEENFKFYKNYLKENKIEVLINQYATAWAESKLFLSDETVAKVSEIHINPDQIYTFYGRYLRECGGIKKYLVPFSPILKRRYLRNLRKLYVYLEKKGDAIVLLTDKFKIFPELQTDKTIAIPNAVDRLGDESLDPKNKEKLIVYVGRMDLIQKSPDQILKAFKIVEQHHPDWHLKMLGEGSDRKKLEELSITLHIKNVEFTGLTNPFPYFEKAAINLLTSNHEGFGMTVVEGMSYKTVPIVYDSYPTASEIITDGKDGYLVEPRDYKGLAEKICYLIDHPEVREMMAEEAYVTVKNRFHIDIVAKKWYSLFNKILSKKLR